MNCVGHIKVYEDALRSYRDLPIKYFEYGIVHRHEASGSLHGLFRVREFTQDDAHIFCRADQIEEQIIEVIDFVDKIMSTFAFDYKMMISTNQKKPLEAMRYGIFQQTRLKMQWKNTIYLMRSMKEVERFMDQKLTSR